MEKICYMAFDGEYGYPRGLVKACPDCTNHLEGLRMVECIFEGKTIKVYKIRPGVEFDECLKAVQDRH